MRIHPPPDAHPETRQTTDPDGRPVVELALGATTLVLPLDQARAVADRLGLTIGDPMTHYARGADFERRTQAHLTGLGYWTARVAGSHGAADLVALRAGEDPLLVQCKTGGWLAPLARHELLTLAKRTGAVPVVASRGAAPHYPLTYRRLTGHGPKDHDPWPGP